MKFRGGYNIKISGRPDSNIRQLPVLSTLSLPLMTKRFNFSDIKVSDGEKVTVGQILAVDPDNFNLPLLAPASATVNYSDGDIAVTLTNISQSPVTDSDHIDLEHANKVSNSADSINQLVDFGGWEFFYEAFSAKLPDPQVTPQAVIVSTVSLEPFVCRGDIQLKKELIRFTRGLEHIQSLLDYQQIYLVLPKLNSDLIDTIRNQIRGYAWAHVVEIDLKYPYDNFNLIARHLNLRSSNGPVWALRTDGVFAVDKILTENSPAIERVISIGGPSVGKPTNISITAGYPIADIIAEFNIPGNTRLINGGILTGQNIAADLQYVDNECRGLTFVPEHTGREFIGWLRPGFDRKSYSNAFASSIIPPFKQKMSTAIRGEVRPCISCNFCEDVCPAGILPHLLHKYIYADQVDELQQSRIDLCVLCGLCSYVCTSKLELRDEFAKAMAVIKEEAEAARIAEEKQKAESENQQE